MFMFIEDNLETLVYWIQNYNIQFSLLSSTTTTLFNLYIFNKILQEENKN